MQSNLRWAQPKHEDIFGMQSDFGSVGLNYEPKSILITGAQGMLGNSLAQALRFLTEIGQLSKTKVILMSRQWPLEVQNEWKKNSNFKLVTNSDLSHSLSHIEVVIHTASPSNITKIESFDKLNEVNVGLLKKIMEFEPSRIIYISSGEVYRNGLTIEGTHSQDFSVVNKRDWYPLAKLEAEFELERFVAKGSSSVGIVRLFHTFGPGVKWNDGRSFADILWGAAINKKITLHSEGSQIRSFLYLSDAVDAILRVAMSNESGYKVLNLGSDKPLSIREFAEMVRELTGSKISKVLDTKFIHSPNDYLVPIIERMSFYDWYQKLDTREGIERTLSWIRHAVKS
jgi:nucleoside-diphosphate-sugar epimerase